MKSNDFYLAHFLEHGLINTDDVTLFTESAEKVSVGVVDLLILAGKINSNDLLNARSMHHGYQRINLHEFEISRKVLDMITPAQAWCYRVIPFAQKDRTTLFVLADPTGLNSIDSLHHMVGLENDVELCITTEEDLLRALYLYYPTGEIEGNRMRDQIEFLEAAD